MFFGRHRDAAAVDSCLLSERVVMERERYDMQHTHLTDTTGGAREEQSRRPHDNITGCYCEHNVVTNNCGSPPQRQQAQRQQQQQGWVAAVCAAATTACALVSLLSHPSTWS